MSTANAPISEAAYGAARPFLAAARADFALVADRSPPKKAPPPNFALFASAAAPGGATPAGYALVADTRAIIANPWSKRALYVAIAILVIILILPGGLTSLPAEIRMRRAKFKMRMGGSV